MGLQTLILNSAYKPITIAPLKRALHKIAKGKAELITPYVGIFSKSGNTTIIPSQL